MEVLRALLHEFFGQSINSNVSPSDDESVISVYIVSILASTLQFNDINKTCAGLLAAHSST
jgi:hypothetical protein